jgi:glycosyltransferase involved in cell wall biosynthesis
MIKINFITYNNQYGLTNDMRILGKMLEKHFGKKVEIKIVDFFNYKAPWADINIFLETVSKILIKYAPINVLIPNQEWYYKCWTPYLNDFDYIFVKTKYAEELFKNLVGDRKNIVKMIGWKSIDRELPNIQKDYNNFLHLCGRSKHKQTQLMIDYWEADFPKLTIVYSPKDVKLVVREDLNNIEYITNRLSDDDLVKLMNKCGVHLCCSETEGYGHYIYEAKSCGSIVVTTNGPPMKNAIDSTMGFIIKVADKKSLKKYLGSKFIIDKEHFQQTIREIQNIDSSLLKKMGQNARDSYLKDARYFDNDIKDAMVEVFRNIKPEKERNAELEKMKEMANNDDILPTVSIITPTYNRRHFFRLAVNNFMSSRYPKDKLEWIIVDDGTDKIKDLIEKTPELKNDPRIKYFELDEKKSIGFKRNFCIEKASNEYIVCMDDDDYYPVNSVKSRILELLKSGKECITCSAIGCFEINKYVSMVNVPPHRLPFSHRISEASMAFKKTFWEEQKFNDNSKHSEAIEFLEGRENKTIEISWEGVLVALLHNRNTSDKIIIDQSPNGCHYGWSDELFLFITSLDRDLTEEEKEKKHKKKKEKGNIQDDDDDHLPT